MLYFDNNRDLFKRYIAPNEMNGRSFEHRSG